MVPKSMADYETFRKEALFLKTLRHPGIPLVYDVEEDSCYSYLIEEYLEGESLYALVKRMGSLSMKTAVNIGIQVCRLIQFMNTAENPILYLDLQPKNLIICREQVRLTDFDHARYAKDAGDFGERYGTVGFAAPEQYSGEPLDCRTDVYAIGALLYFMVKGTPPGREPEYDGEWGFRKLMRIIRGCMAERKEERYPDAGELEQTLKELQEESEKEQAMQSQIITFAGAKPGIGTTHAALGMANFLARNGYSSLYQEEYDTAAARTLAKNMGVQADKTGVYHIGCTNIRPYYGNAVTFPYLYYPIIVKDTGCIWQEEKRLPRADVYVLVCGGKWWETGDTLRAAGQLAPYGKVVLLFNHMTGGIRLSIPKTLSGFPCLFLPYFPNPFRAGRPVSDCYEKILNAGGISWEQKKPFWKRKRPGAES